MNWADLRVLLAVGRAETLTEAGRQLQLDQTTVSRRLTQLEGALGAAVVIRSRDGLSLTAAGERLFRAAELVEATVIEAQRDVLGRDAELSGKLRVTTADMFAQHHADLFTSFAERYPRVAMEVSTGYSMRSLARREADVALRFTAAPEPFLFGRKLVRFAYAPYAAQSLVRRIGKRARLTSFPWLAWDPSVGARRTERWMQEHLASARVVGWFDGWLAYFAAAQAGLGAAVLPCAYAEGAGLVRLRRPFDELGYDLWALTHQDLRRTARVRVFLEHVGHYVQARRGYLESGASGPRGSGQSR